MKKRPDFFLLWPDPYWYQRYWYGEEPAESFPLIKYLFSAVRSLGRRKRHDDAAPALSVQPHRAALDQI